MSLVRKIKTVYYNNLDHKKVVDNKSFWKYIKPHFPDKSSNSNKITLVEKDLIIDQNEEIAETFTVFYSEAVSNLNIIQYKYLSVNFEQVKDPVLRAIEHYKNHLSILAINAKFMEKQFSFQKIRNQRGNFKSG